MKKIILSVAVLTMFHSAIKAQDKAFKKGDIVADIGAGLDFYGTKIHQYILGYTHDTTDAAGGTHFPFKVEYGISNWLGVGARFNFSNFIEETDSVTHIKPTTKSQDAGIVLNFHFVKSKHFDMPLSLTFGYSHFKIYGNDPQDNQAKANGLGYGISLLPRIYFGEHIGMYFNVGYMGYNYKNLIYSNKDYKNINEQVWQDATVSLKANGVNLGIGLVVKF